MLACVLVLNLIHTASCNNSQCVCICIIVIFFSSFGYISSCSHLCPKRRMGWAQFDRRGHDAGGLGAIRAVCRAWQAFQTFLALGTLEANPRVPATSPGIGFLHSLSPCTHVGLGCKPGFSAYRGYRYISLATILPPSSSPGPQQQQPATLRACGCCCSR